MAIFEANYTQIPNVVLDSLHLLSGAELKLISFVCRQTFGYQRQRAKLSISFMMKGTGLSRQGVVNASESLILRGWLEKTKDADSFDYGLVVNSVDQSNQLTSQLSRPEVVNSVDQTSQLSRPEVVNSVDTNKERSLKKDLKETLSKKEREGEKKEPVQTKPIAQFVEPSEELAPLSKFKTSAQSFEDKFRPPAPWRLSKNRNDFKPAFVEAIRVYLAELPSGKGKTVTLADAKAWIARREFDEQGLSEIEIRWEAFQPSAATVSGAVETDWETDPRSAAWLEELKERGFNRFRAGPDGRIDPERSAFCKWVDKTQGAYL